MGLKIQKIEINNFKVFENKVIDFQSCEFVVFDGPNGFGKTSFYDAIELFFTGRIRRYNELSEAIIDKRLSFDEHPYMNHQSTRGDLYIKCHFSINGKDKYLIRRANRDYLKHTTKIKDTKIDLFELSSFEDSEEKKIVDEEQYLASLLGKNYLSNFEHLNYIEQEENIAYLKSKDSEKSDSISHLFNTKKFEEQISKLSELSKSIGKLCNKSAKDKLISLNQQIEVDKKKLSIDVRKCDFNRIADWKELIWDKEEIDFSIYPLSLLIGEEGKLTKVKDLATNRNEYYKYLKNKKLAFVLSDEELLKEFLTYYNFMSEYHAYESIKEDCKEIDNFIEEINNGVLKSFQEDKLQITLRLTKIVGGDIEVGEYNKKREIIKTSISNLDNVDRIIADLRSSRETLIQNFDKYRKQNEAKGNCPLCGYKWDSIELYDNSVKEQTAKLETYLNQKNKLLNDEISYFSETFLVKVKESFSKYKNDKKFDPIFFKNLKVIYTTNKRTKILYLKGKIEAHNIEYGNFLNKEFKTSAKNKLEDFKKNIRAKIESVDETILKDYYHDIYTSEFDNNQNNLNSIDLKLLHNKIGYIEYTYNLYQNKTIQEIDGAYKRQKIIFDNSKIIKQKITAIKKVYETSLKEHHQKVIDDIGILFHIYSGRIVQNYQGGLGLFIVNEKGIKFVENPKKSYDAIFNMSSGQLASLIISFTLALNKKYSQNKILLIDDPIQTMDDLNIASFIDVLRNDFKDRQILISTHEDMMSAFMRYKFKKYGVKSKRVQI
jgi:DNA repair exonuclease SbcCD ATPase subunit